MYVYAHDSQTGLKPVDNEAWDTCWVNVYGTCVLYQKQPYVMG